MFLIGEARFVNLRLHIPDPTRLPQLSRVQPSCSKNSRTYFSPAHQTGLLYLGILHSLLVCAATIIPVSSSFPRLLFNPQFGDIDMLDADTATYYCTTMVFIQSNVAIVRIIFIQNKVTKHGDLWICTMSRNIN